MKVHTRLLAGMFAAACRRGNAMLLLSSIALVATPSAAARIATNGGNCVEANDSTPEIMYGASMAENFGPNVETFICGTVVNFDKTLLSVGLTVSDVHATKAVECTVCNGNFCTSIASTGSSGVQFMNVDLPDALWTGSTVRCSVPELVGSSSSRIVSIIYTTN